MRVFYADPGLLNNQSHHANSCRSICRGFRRLGVHVVVLGCMDMRPELREEIGATPFFHGYTYATLTTGDPVCGALTAFDYWHRVLSDDMGRLLSASEEDIVYLNSAQPAQFMGAIRWWASLPANYRPHVVVEFGTDPGVDVLSVDCAGDFSLGIRDYRLDSRPMFYRFAAQQLGSEGNGKFHLNTFDEDTSRIFSSVINRPVGVLPLPQDSHLPLVSRTGRSPITIAVLGHQRPDKGYQFVPEVVRSLLEIEPRVRFLIHNSVPTDMKPIQEAMRALANETERVTLDERPVGAQQWSELLRSSDLMLCPYEPTRYMASYSAVVTDAVANGIPAIVPDNTSLARLLRKFGDAGVTYNGHDPAVIVAATRQAIASFDLLAGRADEAAARWTATMGGDNTAKAILAQCAIGESTLDWSRSCFGEAL